MAPSMRRGRGTFALALVLTLASLVLVVEAARKKRGAAAVETPPPPPPPPPPDSLFGIPQSFSIDVGGAPVVINTDEIVALVQSFLLGV